jgi:hypothetical protein
MPVNGSTNSNLFSIDLDEIENIITDANIELLKQFEILQNKLIAIPKQISNQNENKEAKKIITELKDIMSDFKKARLEDGRPFTEATKIIKNWFNIREYELKTSLKDLNKKVSDFLLDIDETETENEEITNLRKEVPVKWSVADFNREELDIDEIKIYLTDFAIQKAIEKHLQIHGPNKLLGVSYEKNAVI